MNPVLLKPESDTGSQVIVLGEVRDDLRDMPWRLRSDALWPHARAALHALRAEHDLLVIEGAGSPAEINLSASDFVNMRTAHAADAACLLVCDIDRGGAFAHLYGTHALLAPEDRARLRGYVLNRFRGDAALLAPGPQWLHEQTGVPTLATLPMWRGHGLPEEDGVLDPELAASGEADALTIAIVAPPRISNLDEFQPLRQLAGVRLRWARDAATLADADWIVLPGSKHTSSDLAWLRAQAMAPVIAAHAARGRPLLAVCGGLQMLGDVLDDPHGVDGDASGLGLLPLRTRFERDKLLRESVATFGALHGVWAPLSHLRVQGYEIRHGRSAASADDAELRAALHGVDGSAIGWQRGSILGLYLHGLFESPDVLRALFGRRARDVRPLDAVFDGLADFIDRHFDPGALDALAR
jgi:adenosylcobyric acid synthase